MLLYGIGPFPATIDLQRLPARRAAMPSDPRSLPVVVVLDRIRSVYNVGSFFRTCDGAGVRKLYLCGYTGFPPHKGIAKTALGAEQQVPWEHRASAAELVDELSSAGYQIVAAETASASVDLYGWTPRFPACIVFGNEVDGVAPEILERADACVSLPMTGVKDSLNVAVAGGAFLYELLRQHRADSL